MPAARAADAPEDWSLHGQATVVAQYHPAFRSPYRGANSLDPASSGRETVDADLFAGRRLWEGGEAYASLEVDQGFGIGNTLGVAGFPSGKAYKIGAASPYLRLQRLFVRQTFDLGGDTETVAPDQNQLATTHSHDRLVVTAGKLSVVDIFDTNSLAHDPASDFLNWAAIDAGAFDYAADAWGYSYGVAMEWTKGWWTLRGGLFDLSRVPNTTALVRGFGQYQLVAEGEARYALASAPGKLKLLGFLNRARMGAYGDALALGQVTGMAPDTALMRRPANRTGFAVNLEQQVVDDLGAFARLSWNEGGEETYEFSEINRGLALGLSLKGTSWSRGDDTVGLAGIVDVLADPARRYFAAGGVGLLIADGVLPRARSEDIVEAYYKAQLVDGLAATLDYQFIANPAYNPDRGPVSVLGLRLHAQF